MAVSVTGPRAVNELGGSVIPGKFSHKCEIGRERVKHARCIKASFYIPGLNFPITKGFRTKISIKHHLHPLQVENCDSNSRLVVDKDDNSKFRLEWVNDTGPILGQHWVRVCCLLGKLYGMSHKRYPS